MREEIVIIEEKRTLFWSNKIDALLKTADARQLEIIYGIASAFLEKSNA